MTKDPIGLLPEWTPQDAVLMAWPDETMDWAATLPEIRACYLLMVRALVDYVPVILLAQDPESVPLRGDYPHRLTVQEMPLNDTWVRDYGSLALIDAEGQHCAADFAFNAWGLKFAADRDNRVTRRLPIFREEVRRLSRQDFVLEGGAVESDGRGCLLTTKSVLTEPNRNPGREGTELLREALFAREVISLETEPLEGDDTDGHIDTLARFADAETIVYAACDDEKHPHYAALRLLREELERKLVGRYRLVALPSPGVKRDESGEILPASYANFLITNGAVLMPTYRDAADERAQEVLCDLFPDRKIIGADALPLIRQHGSIHCATMQIPRGFVREEYL